MKPVTDTKNENELLIITKYNLFFKYLYPMLINMSAKHRVLRDMTIEMMLRQYTEIQIAYKTNQISKLHSADAGIATIREFLRILASRNVKLLSLKQYGNASEHLAEVGSLLGSKINKINKVRRG